MKRIFLIAAAGLFLFSCQTGDNTETTTEKSSEKPALTSAEYTNAYIDTINTVSDSLTNMYSRVLDIAATSRDSANMAMMIQLPIVDMLNKRLDELNMAVSDLKTKEFISEEDYNSLSTEIDMSDLGQKVETLRTLGIEPRSEVK